MWGYPQPACAERLVRRYQTLTRNHTDLALEQAYKGGLSERRGMSGSVRLDVVQRNANGVVQNVFDYKFGKAGLSPTRIQTIQRHTTPLGGLNPGVYEIRPYRGLPTGTIGPY